MTTTSERTAPESGDLPTDCGAESAGWSTGTPTEVAVGQPGVGTPAVVRHTVPTSTATFRLCLVIPATLLPPTRHGPPPGPLLTEPAASGPARRLPPPGPLLTEPAASGPARGQPLLTRRRIGEALADAVGELRAMDTTFSPARRDSLVARVRRGELSPDSYPPLAELVRRCAAMRAATDGWFDAWAVPGGFDPSGLLKGWAVERAAARLRAAGITDFAVAAGADVLVRGRAPHGGPWRIGIRDPGRPRAVATVLSLTDGAVATSGAAGRRGHIVDPRTGKPADELAVTTVIGPDLSVADGYATGLYAAGSAGLAWFPTPDGYRALVLDPALANHHDPDLNELHPDLHDLGAIAT